MRHTVKEADQYIDCPIPVLDHGFVMLKDYMGSDAAIPEAARLSTSGVGASNKSDDEGLIRYLMNHAHTSPFEMVELKFHCAMPIFVARQWIRHRTANVNEMSGRYSQLPELTYVPAAAQIAYQSPTNKQGRGGIASPEVAQQFREAITEDALALFDRYREYLGQGAGAEPNCFPPEQLTEVAENGGISRELARINLPLSTYTQWYWKIDLHNLFHFLALRLDAHAQWEIRQYAQAMAEIVKALCPIAWRAFEDYRLNSIRLSGPEIAALHQLLASLPWLGLKLSSPHRLSPREIAEFRAKLIKLGLRHLSDFRVE